MKNKVLLTIGVISSWILFLSCGKDDPDKSEGKMGTLSVTVAPVPSGIPLSCYLYTIPGEKPLFESTTAASGSWQFDKELAAGHYTLSLWGFDPKEASLQEMDIMDKTFLSLHSSGDTIFPLSHPVCKAFADGVEITAGSRTVLEMAPEALSRVVRLEVDAGAGFKDATIRATLGGIASTVRFVEGKPVPGEGRLLLLKGSMMPLLGIYSLAGGVLGLAPDAANGHLLSLTFTTSGGEIFTQTEDITQALASAWVTGRDTVVVAVKAQPAVPVHLYTGIRTRALVDAFDKTAVSIAAGRVTGQYTESWAGIATGGEICLQPERYYPADGSPLYLRGYYPAAPLDGDRIHYTLTGQEDLMLSTEQSGSLSRRFDANETSLTYSHLLSQLNFSLNLKGQTDGYKVRSVRINGLASEAVVSLASGLLTPAGKPISVVLYTDPGTGGFPVIDGKVSLPGYLLVQPEAALTLDLVLAINNNPADDLHFTNLPIRFEGEGGESGTAYKVEVELKVPDTPATPDPPVPPVDPEDPDTPEEPGKPDPPEPPVDPNETWQVKVKATVIPWQAGNNGGVIL